MHVGVFACKIVWFTKLNIPDLRNIICIQCYVGVSVHWHWSEVNDVMFLR